MELTILMPCLNERETLPGCIAEAQLFLAQAGVEGEILIADNGSTDGSQAVAQARGARVVQVARRGYGAALRGGIEAARGAYVIMGDSDGSYPFDELDGFLAALRAGAQLVVGDRYAVPCEPGAAPWLNRRVGVPFLSWLGRRLGDCAVRDFHCGLRAVERRAFLTLGARADGMEFASEMILLAGAAGQTVAQAPVRLRRDGRGRRPHLRPLRDGLRHVAVILRLARQARAGKREAAAAPARKGGEKERRCEHG